MTTENVGWQGTTIITTQDKKNQIEIDGKIYLTFKDILHKRVSVIKNMDYGFDVFRDKFGNYVLSKFELYPCFDSSDRMYENRYYNSYMICASKDELIEKYNFIIKNNPCCKATKYTPSFLAPLIYVDDGLTITSIMTNPIKFPGKPLNISKPSIWGKLQRFMSLLIPKMFR